MQAALNVGDTYTGSPTVIKWGREYSDHIDYISFTGWVTTTDSMRLEASAKATSGAFPSLELLVNGDIIATGSVSWNSDSRLKDNQEIIDNAINRMKDFRGKKYHRNDNNEMEIGFVAQDLLELPIIKNLVVEPKTEGDYYRLNYGNITALHHEAILENN